MVRVVTVVKVIMYTLLRGSLPLHQLCISFGVEEGKIDIKHLYTTCQHFRLPKMVIIPVKGMEEGLFDGV